MSIGIALFPTDAADAEGLVRAAATALHHAKREDTDSHRFYAASMNEAEGQRLDIERRLRRLLAREAPSVAYQPIVNAGDGRICGVEALFRPGLVDPELRDLDACIAVAEDTGCIAALGEQVLQRACQDAWSWSTRGHDLQVSVNLSPRELRWAELPVRVGALLRKTGLPPERLLLEITERAVVHDDLATRRTLRALRSMGVGLALDDFGTGFAGLSNLRHLPLDRVKIDRSFVKGIPDQAEDTAVVAATVQLARSLGIEVVAEGVETPEQAEALRELGCDRLQGFRFAPALAAEDLLPHLERGWIEPAKRSPSAG